jgi:hypothetical protein
MKEWNLTPMLFLILAAAPPMSFAQGQRSPQPVNADASHGENSAAPAAPEPAGAATTHSAAATLSVVCKGGQLAISANGSTLGSILAEVNKCLDSQIDVPENVSGIRFFDTLGPGSVREVLVDLFSYSGLNFVIESSGSDPDKVGTIMLFANTNSLAETTASSDRKLTVAQQAFMQMHQRSAPHAEESESQASADDSAAVSSDASREAPPAKTETNSAPTVPDSNQASPASRDANSQAPGEAMPATPPNANAPPSTSSAPASNADTSSQQQPSEADQQITNMEQMFQQRRQMLHSPPQPPQ